jgi:hypothetical protein
MHSIDFPTRSGGREKRGEKELGKAVESGSKVVRGDVEIVVGVLCSGKSIGAAAMFLEF